MNDSLVQSQKSLSEQINLRGFTYTDCRGKRFAFIDYMFFEEWSVNDISPDGSRKKVSMWTESILLDKEFIIELLKSMK